MRVRGRHASGVCEGASEHVRRSGAASSELSPSERVRTQHVQNELGRCARKRLREHMASLILSGTELVQLWRLLRLHASPPFPPEESSYEVSRSARPGANWADSLPAAHAARLSRRARAAAISACSEFRA